MSATIGFAFSCDSPDGCHAHAMVAGDVLPTARDVLCDVLGWTQGDNGGVLCADHVGQDPVQPVKEPTDVEAQLRELRAMVAAVHRVTGQHVIGDVEWRIAFRNLMGLVDDSWSQQ